MKNIYIFPAIFDYANDGISIEFPDLPGCLSCADTTEKAFYNAKEVLGLFLWGMEEDKEDIPEPSPIDKIKLQKNQAVVFVEVFMPLVRDEMNNKAVKKTLSIPKWLNDLAEKNKVNFSRVLQESLKNILGIAEKKDDH